MCIFRGDLDHLDHLQDDATLLRFDVDAVDHQTQTSKYKIYEQKCTKRKNQKAENVRVKYGKTELKGKCGKSLKSNLIRKYKAKLAK